MEISCIAANDCSSSDSAPAVKQLVPFEGQRQDTRLKRLERNVDDGGVAHLRDIISESVTCRSGRFFLPDLARLTAAELLRLHVQIGEELRTRGVVRSANNPAGDLAEHLFCAAFGWAKAPNSERGYNATGPDGTRFQIKGRRVHRRNPSRQLSAIRDLECGHFDVLAGVIFDDDFCVVRAALIPRGVVEARSTYVALTNSQKFHPAGGRVVRRRGPRRDCRGRGGDALSVPFDEIFQCIGNDLARVSDFIVCGVLLDFAAHAPAHFRRLPIDKDLEVPAVPVADHLDFKRASLVVECLDSMQMQPSHNVRDEIVTLSATRPPSCGRSESPE